MLIDAHLDLAMNALLLGRDVTKSALDTREHRVTWEGREIALSPKEFGLLELFMRNPRAALTEGLILEKVWDCSVDPFQSNTVSVHVRSLRRKLAQVGRHAFIRTLPRRGYRFEPD